MNEHEFTERLVAITNRLIDVLEKIAEKNITIDINNANHSYNNQRSEQENADNKSEGTPLVKNDFGVHS